MRHPITIAVALISLALSIHAQTVSNHVLEDRIRSAKAEKSISLTFDKDAKTSKIMAVSENFSKGDASRSGILAMNFAIGFFYAGDALTKSSDSYLLAFWVLTKKPRFGANHAMTVALREEMLVIGNARYVAKPREQMEYLNFQVSRENLTKIAAQTEVRFQLGDEEFSFTRSQMRLLADVLTITEL
jgi:hypothetical protein